jgi:hypothetical protein
MTSHDHYKDGVHYGYHMQTCECEDFKFFDMKQCVADTLTSSPMAIWWT